MKAYRTIIQCRFCFDNNTFSNFWGLIFSNPILFTFSKRIYTAFAAGKTQPQSPSSGGGRSSPLEQSHTLEGFQILLVVLKFQNLLNSCNLLFFFEL